MSVEDPLFVDSLLAIRWRADTLCTQFVFVCVSPTSPTTVLIIYTSFGARGSPNRFSHKSSPHGVSSKDQAVHAATRRSLMTTDGLVGKIPGEPW